ncbi:hypothetical protein IJT93_04910 [bacterium]|nr:hypothetical protein [bacterium]
MDLWGTVFEEIDIEKLLSSADDILMSGIDIDFEGSGFKGNPDPDEDDLNNYSNTEDLDIASSIDAWFYEDDEDLDILQDPFYNKSAGIELPDPEMLNAFLSDEEMFDDESELEFALDEDFDIVHGNELPDVYTDDDNADDDSPDSANESLNESEIDAEDDDPLNDAEFGAGFDNCETFDESIFGHNDDDLSDDTGDTDDFDSGCF